MRTGLVCVTNVCTADTTLSTAIRITMPSRLMEGAPLIYISPSPRVSWSCVCVARQVLFTMPTGLIERAPLIYISPYPRVSWSCFYVARQVLFSLMLLTPLIGPTPMLLLLENGANLE